MRMRQHAAVGLVALAVGWFAPAGCGMPGDVAGRSLPALGFVAGFTTHRLGTRESLLAHKSKAATVGRPQRRQRLAEGNARRAVLRRGGHNGVRGATAVFLPPDGGRGDGSFSDSSDDDEFTPRDDDEGGPRSFRDRSDGKRAGVRELDVGQESVWEEATSAIRAYDPITGYGMETPEELNERYRPTGLERHRLVLAPDEAFGSIFRFEGVIADTMPVHKKAWEQVAREMNLTQPDDSDVRMAMTMPVEKAIQRVMYWTNDWGDTKRIAFRKAELFYELWKTHNHTVDADVVRWLAALQDAAIPTCLTSQLDRSSVELTLNTTGIAPYFSKMVCAEDDCDTRSQFFLKAAIKLKRPPQFCVVFDSDPEGISASRDIQACCVALLGSFAAYELTSADLTVSSFADLSTYNIRRMFAAVGEGNRADQEPQLELETATARRRRGPWGSYEDDEGDEFVRVPARY